ncbi:unnamed protein product, partial [Rotaria sp. Silwood1]
LTRCVESSTTSSLSVQSNLQYFFLIRHGIYFSTSCKDEGLIELGRKQERVVGAYTDQISIISRFIPDNKEEARHILFIFNQYNSQIMINKERLCVIDRNLDSDNEEEENDD